MDSHDSLSLQITDLLDNLAQLDADLLANYGLERHFDIVIVGSSPLILLGLLSPERRTTDIDVLEAPEEVLEFLDRYGMNTMVATFLYSYPETWRDRMRKIRFDGDSLNIYTMSLEDLLIMKLLAFRERDQEDLKDVVVSGEVDWGKLDALINDPAELRINMSTDEDWEELLRRYNWLIQMKDSA